MSRLIGIDFGTTNSCVTFMENGRAVVCPRVNLPRAAVLP